MRTVVSRALWLCLIFVAGLLLSGCGASNSTFADWTSISEQTKCEALNPNACSGLYGFTITSTGQFVAGPSPGGAVSRGSITADESIRLLIAADEFLSSITSTAACPLGPITPGVGDGISIIGAAGESFIVLSSNVSPPGNCVIANPQKTTTLATLVQQLRLKYYPLPFP